MHQNIREKNKFLLSGNDYGKYLSSSNFNAWTCFSIYKQVFQLKLSNNFFLPFHHALPTFPKPPNVVISDTNQSMDKQYTNI